MSTVEEYRDFFFDPEVLMREGSAAVGGPDLLQEIRDDGRAYLVTDDTRFTSGELESMMSNQDLEGFNGILTGIELVSEQVENREALVFGEQSLLENCGLRSSVEAEDVLVGLDRRYNYQRLAEAASKVAEGGRLIICSRRRMTRIRNERPHQAMLNAALETFGEPELIGFPSDGALNVLRENFSFLPESSLMVVDRLDMVEAGNRAGMDTALLVDRSNRDLLEEEDDAIRTPDYGLTSIHSLNQELWSSREQ